jgi:hypothetical protein
LVAVFDAGEQVRAFAQVFNWRPVLTIMLRNGRQQAGSFLQVFNWRPLDLVFKFLDPVQQLDAFPQFIIVFHLALLCCVFASVIPSGTAAIAFSTRTIFGRASCQGSCSAPTSKRLGVLCV